LECSAAAVADILTKGVATVTPRAATSRIFLVLKEFVLVGDLLGHLVRHEKYASSNSLRSVGRNSH
jgi:hypothetical protein